jgi:Cu+-exporting ATPase
MRVLGRNKFYLKSTEVVEHMSHMNTIVFDKTGTLTQPHSSIINYQGKPLTLCQQQIVSAAVAQSIHPLSQKIKQHLQVAKVPTVSFFEEVAGKGIKALVNQHEVMLGASTFVNADLAQQPISATRVYVQIDGSVKGYYEISQTYREGLEPLLAAMQPNYDTYLLSGDNDKERDHLMPYFKKANHLLFNQTPADKLAFIAKLQHQHQQVVMIGDGLNDAGALKAANMGISITENTSHFTPASDVIMDAEQFHKLAEFFKFSKNTMQVIHVSFVISLLYNLVGLTFAVQGNLSPLVAAILMPLSSITVIVFTTLSTSWMAKRRGLV